MSLTLYEVVQKLEKLSHRIPKEGQHAETWLQLRTAIRNLHRVEFHLDNFLKIPLEEYDPPKEISQENSH